MSKYLPRFCIFSLLILQFVEICFSAELANVPLEHEVYPFLDRMVAKGFLPIGLTSTKPITRLQAAEAINRVRRQHNRKKISLTKTERAHLEKFINIFAREFPEKKIPEKKKADYLFSATGKDYELNFDSSIKQETFLTRLKSGAGADENDVTTLVSMRPLFFGEITENFAFVTDFRYGVLVDGEGYEERPNELRFSSGNLEQVTTMEAYGKYGWRNLSIEVGKDDLWWGPGRNSSLILSDNSASKDLVKLYAKARFLKFTAFTAELREDKESILKKDPSLIWEGQKYLSAHRLEATLFNRIHLGVSEAVVASRLDFGYVNPFTVYYFSLRMTEYGKEGGHGYSADNFFVGGDLTVNLAPGLQIYGEFLGDDYQPQEGLFTRNWDNKFGVLFGAYYTFKDLDLRAEYAFVNQYAYTHEFPSINSYTNRGRVIGHKIGPDADNFWINLAYWLNPKVWLSVAYELERHGETTIDKPHELDAPGEWEFLSGVTETTDSLDLRAKYSVIGDYLLQVKYKYSHVKNAGNEPGSEEDHHKILFGTEYRF